MISEGPDTNPCTKAQDTQHIAIITFNGMEKRWIHVQQTMNNP